uniref:Uncharacterized protein n=1 Tax=Arundo donax TaxID=35708 RepID=A0A0A8YJY0_ARUDO
MTTSQYFCCMSPVAELDAKARGPTVNGRWTKRF